MLFPWATKSLVAGVLGALSLMTAAPSASGQLSAPLRVSLSLDSQSVPLHAILKITVKIINDDPENSYVIYLGPDDDEAFTMRVQEPNGTTASFTKKMGPGLHPTGKHVIPPDGVYSEELVLNRWYDFPTPGAYHVELAMKSAFTEGSSPSRGIWPQEAQPLNASMKAEITILPRDIAYLTNECQRLVNTIRSAHSYTDVFSATKALTAIHDPIAAPYLAEAAEFRPTIAYSFIDALQTLATNEAVDGLFKLTRDQHAELRALALSALERLETSEQDPGIKKRIESGLASIQPSSPVRSNSSDP